ncbi:hypothetical protein CKO24_10645 [Rhodothalassium salexigens DSM 2132]|nr:hypothetical protein [Rhodothalassium salexigens DSM 2132]
MSGCIAATLGCGQRKPGCFVKENHVSGSGLTNSPFLLGFDELERVMDAVAKSGNNGYPPYNIEELDSHHLRISLAVAGFSQDELDVTVKDNQLVIHGRQDDDDQRTYLYRGIAARQFQRRFVLADGITVTGAHMDNGLLHVDLARPEPESVVRSIKIETAPAAPRSVVPQSRSRQGDPKQEV